MNKRNIKNSLYNVFYELQEEKKYPIGHGYYLEHHVEGEEDNEHPRYFEYGVWLMYGDGEYVDCFYIYKYFKTLAEILAAQVDVLDLMADDIWLRVKDCEIDRSRGVKRLRGEE